MFKLDELTDEQIAGLTRSLLWQERAIAALSAKITQEDLSRLLEDENSFVRSKAVRHPMLSKKQIYKMASDVEPKVRLSLLKRNDLTNKVLARLVFDGNEQVRTAAREATLLLKANLLDDDDSEIL